MPVFGVHHGGNTMKKFLLLATLVVASIMPAHAEWRPPGQSLYGGPSGEAMTQEFQNRARLDEALRNGDAGYTGETRVINVITSAGGCTTDQTTTVDGADDTTTDSTATCTNTGDVDADTTVIIGNR